MSRRILRAVALFAAGFAAVLMNLGQVLRSLAGTLGRWPASFMLWALAHGPWVAFLSVLGLGCVPIALVAGFIVATPRFGKSRRNAEEAGR